MESWNAPTSKTPPPLPTQTGEPAATDMAEGDSDKPAGSRLSGIANFLLLIAWIATGWLPDEYAEYTMPIRIGLVVLYGLVTLGDRIARKRREREAAQAAAPGRDWDEMVAAEQKKFLENKPISPR